MSIAPTYLTVLFNNETLLLKVLISLHVSHRQLFDDFWYTKEVAGVKLEQQRENGIVLWLIVWSVARWHPRKCHTDKKPYFHLVAKADMILANQTVTTLRCATTIIVNLCALWGHSHTLMSLEPETRVTAALPNIIGTTSCRM